MFDIWIPPKPAIIRPAEKKLVKANFLPGSFPCIAASAVAKLTTLTQVGSGTATAVNGSITSSVSVLTGDLLVFGGGSSGPSGSASIPTSSTFAVTEENTATLKRGITYRIANSNLGTSITGFSATGGGETVFNNLYVFRGNVPILGVTVGSPQNETTIGNPAAQVVTSSSGTPPLIVVAHYRSSGTIDPRSFTPAKDGEINAAVGDYLAYRIYNTSPANVTVDMEDEGTNGLQSCYLAFS